MLSDLRRWFTAISRRLGGSAITLLLASLLIFGLVNALPSDTALAALGHESTEAQRERFREAMGLNDPPVERYLNWLGGAVQGDFGISTVSGQPIGPALFDRLKHTAVLTLGSLVLALLIALPMAVFVATRAGGRRDATVSAAAVSIAAVPEYVIAIGILVLFGSTLRLFPPLSIGVTSGDPSAYVMPIATLALVTAAYIYRSARASLIEALNAPHVRAAILRGYSRRRVLWGHVVPNASSSVINVIGLNLIYVFGGVIVVESVFAYPGLGTLLISGIQQKDFPVVAGVALLMSFWIIIVNLAVDSLVLALNPRLRTRRAQ